MIVDCENIMTGYGIHLEDPSVPGAITWRLENMEVRNIGSPSLTTTRSVFCEERLGRFELINTKIRGSGRYAWNMQSDAFANNGNSTLYVNQFDFGTWTTSGVVTDWMNIERGSATYTASATIIGVTGQLDCTSQTGLLTGIHIQGVDDSIISDSDFTLNIISGGSNEAKVISVAGTSTVSADDCQILRNRVLTNSPAGHAIQFGNSTNNSYMSGGRYAGNYAEDTGGASIHGQSLGMSTTAEMQGNVSKGFLVGFLVSKTTTADVQGNLSVDPRGPGIHGKGTTAATIKGNVVSVSSSTVRDTGNGYGLIDIRDQSSTDTAGCTVTENICILQNGAELDGTNTFLAVIQDGNQVCTFTNNTYYVPDTVDLTDDIFYHSTPATYAEWLATSEVTGDVVIQLPQAEIDTMIRKYDDQAKAAGRKLGGAGSTGFSL